MGVIYPRNSSNTLKLLMTLLLIGLSPVLIAAVLLYFLWGAILYLALWLTWRQPHVVFVYSDSPVWKGYIEREILQPLQGRAVILNWSERKRWKNSLDVLAFRYFAGVRNFNPIGMVFRPFRLMRTYRFFEAFKEYKHGNPRRVEEVRDQLFTDMGIDARPGR